MAKRVAQTIMIATTIVWLVLVIFAPWILGDKNGFLKSFVSTELLTLLGVIVSITLASAANLHLAINRIEENGDGRKFDGTRASIKRSASWLIIMFVVAIILVVCKPFICPSERAESFFNGAALLIVLFNVLVMTDLVQAVFEIKPYKKQGIGN